MKKETKTNIVFLLDRSGSMASAIEDTIGGYNSYLKKFKSKNAYITTILFDDKYEVITKDVKANEVKELTSKEYFVRGTTALLDAIGMTINALDDEKKEKVMFIITTDGYENASVKFTKEQIKEMILGHQNFEFIYIGADIDSYTEASSLGIKASNTSNYVKDKKGISKMFKAVEKACTMYCEKEILDESWKKDLE